MATQFTGNDFDGIVVATNEGLWINAAGTYVTNAAAAFDFGSTLYNRLIVYGLIASEDGNGIASSATSGSNTIEVMRAAGVSGANYGIDLGGIYQTIINNGTINGPAGGLHLTGDANGGSYCQVLNYGEITGVVAVHLTGEYGRVVNTGTITGRDYGVWGVGVSNFRLANAGAISAEIGISLSIKPGATDGTWTANTGSISARNHAYLGTEAADILLNSGTMAGRTGLGAGNDSLRNTGRMDGQINLDAGDDLLASSSGIIVGEILGGAGSDTISAGLGNNLARGGADGDVIRGNAGDDTLYGDAGNDLLAGGDDDDLLDGGDGFDKLFGGDGEDSLFGGASADDLRSGDGDDALDGGTGNDTLVGGCGTDRVIGGANSDHLYGGADADVFVFGKFDSGLSSFSDTIHDFQHGIDTIDLSAVIPGVLQFMGSAAFAGGGTASVRAVTPAVGQSSVFVDYDGNGTADMRILLNNHPALTVEDFIL